MSSVRFHGYSMYTCSYYRSLFLVCHQLGSMAIVCVHVVTTGLCSKYIICFFVDIRRTMSLAHPSEVIETISSYFSRVLARKKLKRGGFEIKGYLWFF